MMMKYTIPWTGRDMLAAQETRGFPKGERN